MANCPICETPINTQGVSHSFRKQVCCPRCGDYTITREAEEDQRNSSFNERQRANASGWIREHQSELITTEMIERLEILRTPTVIEKADLLLKFLAKESKYFGAQFGISLVEASDPSAKSWEEEKGGEEFLPILKLMGITWAVNGQEVLHLLEYLTEEKFIAQRGRSISAFFVSLLAKGFSYIEQLNTVNLESNIGFCAMWFDDSLNFLWDKAIEPAIGNTGYQPLRIDKKEHVNRIDDEIFADIRRSRFVVADFTHGEKGVRGGVYFEAGFAQGLGLPVIWTCRKDMLSEDKLHFDIRQYNFLEWTDDSLDDFKDRLQKRIEAILGRGTWKPST
jgi:hypothetical protein